MITAIFNWRKKAPPRRSEDEGLADGGAQQVDHLGGEEEAHHVPMPMAASAMKIRSRSSLRCSTSVMTLSPDARSSPVSAAMTGSGVLAGPWPALKVLVSWLRGPRPRRLQRQPGE